MEDGVCAVAVVALPLADAVAVVATGSFEAVFSTLPALLSDARSSLGLHQLTQIHVVFTVEAHIPHASLEALATPRMPGNLASLHGTSQEHLDVFRRDVQTSVVAAGVVVAVRLLVQRQLERVSGVQNPQKVLPVVVGDLRTIAEGYASMTTTKVGD